MPEQPTIKTKPYGGIFMGIGGIFMGTFSALLFCYGFRNGYPQILPLIGGCFFSVFALPCFWMLLFSENFYVLYQDRLLTYSYARIKTKTIFIRDIVRWEENEIEGSDYRALTVYTDRKKFSINSKEEHYEEIKKHLTRDNLNGTHKVVEKENEREIQENKNRSAIKTNLFLIIFFSPLAVWLIFAGLRSYFDPNSEFKNLSLIQISGVAKEVPEIHTGSKNKNVYLRLNGYPNFDFLITGVGYNATYLNYLNRIQPGDSVFLTIDKDDYQKYLTKEKPLGFWDKTMSDSRIFVYELSDTEYTYLSIANYKAVNIRQRNFGILMATLGFVVFILWPAWHLYKLKTKIA